MIGLRAPVVRRFAVLALAVATVGCGSTSSTTQRTPSTEALATRLEPAGPNPSASARMICAAEARVEIRAALGTQETRITPPTWVDHVYSCSYAYPNGAITLSVKELSNLAATRAYFNRLERTLGRAQWLYGLGQGAFIGKNGDAVVRKDYKVLHVDVQGIPADFSAVMIRPDVAQNIAVTIMACWNGS